MVNIHFNQFIYWACVILRRHNKSNIVQYRNLSAVETGNNTISHNLRFEHDPSRQLTRWEIVFYIASLSFDEQTADTRTLKKDRTFERFDMSPVAI